VRRFSWSGALGGGIMASWSPVGRDQSAPAHLLVLLFGDIGRTSASDRDRPKVER
jgi:hypothetical protein